MDGFKIKSHKYTVRLAESREEVEAALRLRFSVFNLELGEGLKESYLNQMDEDKYDAQCHHLLVIHNKTEEVIGTYRMQDNDHAEKGEGFYTQEEFDVSRFGDEVLSNA
ncbi:MAG: GNAT family N-acetyltransferase, partial [Bacteroidota bacterium]